MKTNIPIYRAKKIDSDEYAEGYLLGRTVILNWENCLFYKDEITYEVMKSYVEMIDPSTLSIHFPDMLDKNNKRIFASLSEDGKGGSEFSYRTEKWGYAVMINGMCYIVDYTSNDSLFTIESLSDLSGVTGIYEGDSNE